jgi:HEAT repeat protein
MPATWDASQRSLNGLIAELASKEAVVREHARKVLVAMRSSEATRALVTELSDPRDHVRWEAAKALASMADPLAVPGLCNALDDDDCEVAWTAGEGLIALGKTGLMAVLHALTKRASSPSFRQAAAHVLQGCAQYGYGELLAPVRAAMTSYEPGVAVPPAAFEALLRLKLPAGERTR